MIGSHIQLIMRHGAMPKDIFAEMERFGLTEENEELMSDFITVMMDMYNNTRMPETRGFTTVEAQKADPSRQKKIASASEIVTSSMPIVKNRADSWRSLRGICRKIISASLIPVSPIRNTPCCPDESAVSSLF